MKLSIVKNALLLGTVFLTAQSFAYGEPDERAPSEFRHRGGERGGPPHGSHDRAAFEACASELGIAKPEPGSKPSDADREKMMNCVRSKMEANRAAMDSCLKAAGVVFGDDGRPTERPSQEVFEGCRTQVEGAKTTQSNTAL